MENGNLRIIRFVSNEELSQFESAAFHGMPYLKELILKKNAIESIRESAVWDNLEVLDLSDNPLRCDCHLLWYKAFLNARNGHLKNNNINENNSINITTHASNYSENAAKTNSVAESSVMNQQHNIICASPVYAKGKEFAKLSSEVFGCTPNSDPKIQAIICGLLVITAATITTLILIAYKCRRRKFRNVLKDSGWDISSAIGHKERDYQKTYAAPQQYIETMRKHTMGATISSPSHCNMPGVNNYQQYPLTSMTPITEL